MCIQVLFAWVLSIKRGHWINFLAFFLAVNSWYFCLFSVHGKTNGFKKALFKITVRTLLDFHVHKLICVIFHFNLISSSLSFFHAQERGKIIHCAVVRFHLFFFVIWSKQLFVSQGWLQTKAVTEFAMKSCYKENHFDWKREQTWAHFCQLDQRGHTIGFRFRPPDSIRTLLSLKEIFEMHTWDSVRVY